MLGLNDYTDAATKYVCYPKDKETEYLVLGLCGEAGEVANKVKKVIRGDKVMDEHLRHDLASELGDVLWYISQLSTVTGYSLEDIARLNIKKLQSRYERNRIKGDGDDR